MTKLMDEFDALLKAGKRLTNPLIFSDSDLTQI